MSKGAVRSERFSEADRYRRFIEVIPLLADYARRAADFEAHSYRGFKVGAATEVIHPETAEFTIIAAGNSKPEHKAKFCAERRVVGRIESEERKTGELLGYVLGLVVAGTTDRAKIAEVTGFETPTLHPCPDCRNTFIDHRLVRDHALVVTTGLSGEAGSAIYQVHTMEELRSHYDNGDDERLSDNVQTFENWDERLRMYDHFNLAMDMLPKKKQLPPWKLARRALSADITA